MNRITRANPASAILVLLILAATLSGCERSSTTTSHHNKLEDRTHQTLPVHTPDVPVCIQTNFGQIELLLHPYIAPQTVKNFLDYATEGFYDNTLIHRVIPGFIIQGGKYNPHFNPKPTHQPIINEASKSLRHHRGTIAMHRTGRDPHSATSEFFINIADNHAFNIPHGYTVFGHVTKGMDVIKQIAHVPTHTHHRRYRHAPQVPVIIEHVYIHTHDDPCLGAHPLIVSLKGFYP